MPAWLSQYGGYALIFGGAVVLSSLIPSAAGPSDALAGVRVQAPHNNASTSAAVPLLIASPRHGSAPIPVIGSGGSAAPNSTVDGAPAVPAAVGAIASPSPSVAVSQAQPTAIPLPPTGRIVIPRIGIDVPVVDVGVTASGEMETAAFAVGRLSFTPQAGEDGNVVLAGHDDILGEVFRRLPELREGDEVTLFRGDTAFHYQVETRTIVREDGATEAQRLDNARWMDQTAERVATLISCYPYRVDTHRIIVRTRLVA